LFIIAGVVALVFFAIGGLAVVVGLRALRDRPPDAKEPGDRKTAIGGIVWASAGMFCFLALVLALLPIEIQTVHRAESARNLVALSDAMMPFITTTSMLPPAAIADRSNHNPLLSWRVLILSNLRDQASKDLYNQFRLDEPWDSPHNKTL